MAFKYENESITFGSLARRADQLASVLIEQGVRRGDRVGIFLGPSIETATAIYGIMNSGAAYVPIDTRLPAARIAYILRDCGIKHLISSQDQRDLLENLLEDDETELASIIGFEADLPAQTISWDDVSQMPEKENSVRVLEDDLAYVMYTSGTTGVPKGIMHTHRSGLNYAKLSKDLYEVCSEDVCGNHSPLHFDISTFGYFTMPLATGTTVIIPEAYKNFPASLSQMVEKEKLTIWYSVPLALTQMLELGVLERRNLESLRLVMFGGEPFPVKHLRKLLELLPMATFSNVYGPAEVNQCTFFNFKTLHHQNVSVPLGRAWGNAEIIVVDEDDREVKKSEIGECLVRTATMMKGYWQQPELTEKSFYKRKRPGGLDETFYRTGDLVKQNENGEMVFVGRKDRQIKLRGYRIELDEIESVLTSHTKVLEAGVYTFKNGADEKQLVASIVPKNGFEISEERLWEHCEKHLPNYAKPGKFVFSQSLPRTAAGKIDHKKLEETASENFNE